MELRIYIYIYTFMQILRNTYATLYGGGNKHRTFLFCAAGRLQQLKGALCEYFICVCIFICIYVYIYIYILYLYTCAYIYIYMYTYIYIYCVYIYEHILSATKNPDSVRCVVFLPQCMFQ